MDNSELLLLLESPDALSAKVDEAIQVRSPAADLSKCDVPGLTQINGGATCGGAALAASQPCRTLRLLAALSTCRVRRRRAACCLLSNTCTCSV